MSFGVAPLVATSAIVSAEIVAGMSVWMAAANGREAALVLRKVRRLSMGPLWPMCEFHTRGIGTCSVQDAGML